MNAQNQPQPTAEIEARLIGAILDAESPILGSNAGALIDSSGLKNEDFTDPRNRVIWDLACRMAQTRRVVAVDTIFSSGRAASAVKNEDFEWLMRLRANNTIDRKAFSELADDLRIESRRRQLRSSLMKTVKDLSAPGSDLIRIVGEVESALRDVDSRTSDDGSGDQDVLELSNDWEVQETGRERAVLLPTGITALDEIIGGLVQNLNVVCGLPSVGKSAMLATMIDAQLRAGVRVGLFGLEDGTKWLAKRIISREMAMPVRSVGTVKRTHEQSAKFGDVAPLVHKRMGNLITYRHDTISIDELCRRAASWIETKGVQCIFVDHGGEIDHHTERFDEYRLRVAESYRRLRNLGIRYKTPIVVLAHTARPSDENEDRPPRVSEIAESSYIERRARLIIGVWRKKSEPDVMRATVLKQTEGAANITVKINRHTQSAMLDEKSGEVVNLDSEKNTEARIAKEKREKEKEETKARLDAMRKKPRQTIFGGVDQ